MRTILSLLLLAVIAAGQEVRITKPDGSHILLSRGTTAGDIETRSFSGVLGVTNTRPSHYGEERTPGAPIPFRLMEARGRGLLLPDGTEAQDDTTWHVLIPEDERRECPWWPQTLGPNGSQVLVPGELIPVFYGTAQFAVPDKGTADLVWHVTSKGLDMDFLLHPRFASMLKQYGISDDPNQVDMHDVHDRWHVYYGGPPRKSWYWPHLAEGYSNMRYDGLLIQAIAWLRIHRFGSTAGPAYRYLLKNALDVCSYGFVWSDGKYSRWFRNEKSGGQDIVGGAPHNRPRTPKEWVRGLMVVEALSGHPMVTEVLNRHRDRVMTEAPDVVYDGTGGARRAAVWLDNLLAHALRELAHSRTYGPIIRKAEAAIRRWMTRPGLISQPGDYVVDGTDFHGIWVNRFAGGKPSSPSFGNWLNAVIARWMETFHICRDLEPDVAALIERTVELGLVEDPNSDAVLPKSMTYFGTSIADRKRPHPSHLGYHVPALRWMARRDSAWYGIYVDTRQALLHHVGGSWGFTPAVPLQHRVGRLGPGLFVQQGQAFLGVIR